jgi:hypothetical protein
MVDLYLLKGTGVLMQQPSRRKVAQRFQNQDISTKASAATQGNRTMRLAASY